MIKAVIFDMYETLITHFATPLYFGAQMAGDAGIPEEKFLSLWRPTERDRTIGKLTFEKTIEYILKENQCYSEKILHQIIERRKQSKEECFKHLHPEIIPMLMSLKRKGIRIGLISNCFSEEVEPIKKSELFPYFDAVCLSYEERMEKPEKAIFERCMERLTVSKEECVYVGDGGSLELEAASKLGMKAIQAVWYLKDDTLQPAKRKKGFLQAETPLEILRSL